MESFSVELASFAGVEAEDNAFWEGPVLVPDLSEELLDPGRGFRLRRQERCVEQRPGRRLLRGGCPCGGGLNLYRH